MCDHAEGRTLEQISEFAPNSQLFVKQKVSFWKMYVYFIDWNAGFNVFQKMAGLVYGDLGYILQNLNPEHVSTLMNTDVELRRFFERTIGARNFVDGKTYLRTRVHEEADASVNSELSVFYRYFISKCYFNLLDSNARSGLLENYASIFPFQVDSSVQIDTVPILDFFDDVFLNEIRQFIDHHVSDSDFTDLENLLVKNIESFR